MRRQEFTLMYDPETDRWIIDAGSRAYSLHCGDCFQLNIGNQCIPCRIEMDWQWYIVMGNTRLDLRVQETYPVVI